MRSLDSWTLCLDSIGLRLRRECLEHPSFADELLDLIELAGQEVGEVLIALVGYHNHVFISEVDLLLGDAELGVDREDMARFQDTRE